MFETPLMVDFVVKQWVLRLCVLLACIFPAISSANPIQTDHIEVELIAEVDSVQPGRPFWVGFRLAPDEQWKTYWRNPGGTGLPTHIEWYLPEGARAGEIRWPYPERFEIQGLTSYGYAGEVILLTEIRPGEALHIGNILSLGATSSWLVCYEECIPGSTELLLELPVKDVPPQLNARWASAFAAARDRLPDEVDGWDASFAIGNNRLYLEVQTRKAVFADAEDITFFPYRQNLISYTAHQEADWTPFRLAIKQQISDRLTTIPDTVSGIIVVTTVAGQESAYAVDFSLEPEGRLLASEGGESTRLPASNELLYVMILAMAGGLLLNLMPCVFPVLSLKAIGLMEVAHISHQAQRLHGLAYTLGVMVFFCAVAGILYLMKMGGASVGWGFQLQTPWFVALLAYLLFILGLNFSGVLEFGGRFMGVGETLAHRGGYLGSFFTGALAAIVASPCTAPFMGTAIAFAIVQPPLYSLLVFLALGFGMALPFLLIAFIPSLERILPRPGPWMDIFKQAMAFPLYLTAVWLLWVLGRQTSATGMAIVLAGMVLLLFAVWLRHLRPQPKGRWRRVNTVLAAAATVSAFAILAMPVLKAPTSTAVVKNDFWEPYSEARLAKLRTQGRPVFVNMTADWCITCMVNERVALSLPSVRQAFKKKDIVPLQGNWTNREPEITRFLEVFGRSGVPLYVLYPPGSDSEPVVLPQWLSPMNVLDALETIQKQQPAKG